VNQEVYPFYSTAEEATHHAILASGKNPKQVGCALYPDKTPEAAATALRNALNPNRDERLTADQHIFIANYVQRFDYVYYVAHRCNHSRPKHETPAEKAAELQEILFQKAEELTRVLEQVNKLRPAA
jgi:hypothetical protein